jgi:hypothetical protein
MIIFRDINGNKPGTAISTFYVPTKQNVYDINNLVVYGNLVASAPDDIDDLSDNLILNYAADIVDKTKVTLHDRRVLYLTGRVISENPSKYVLLGEYEVDASKRKRKGIAG